MNLPARTQRSLKTLLLGRLVPALVGVMLIGLGISNHQLRGQVDAAYDRSLAGALRAMDLNISTTSGGLSMEQPYLLFEFFQLTAANGHVYYRVATEDGLAEIGSQGLPLPDRPLISGKPQFFYADYLGEPVRVAAMARPMNPPLYNNDGGRVIVQVAESLETRRDFLHSALAQSAGIDAAIILISLMVVIWSVFTALKPLERLKDDMARRPTDDLGPVHSGEVPTEVLPLIDAVNLHMARYTEQARMQRQFLDDASHQLRTPLSVLQAQINYALRESDPREIRDALLAMQDGLDRAVRTCNQMLALARAKDPALSEEAQFESVDLEALAHSVVRGLMPAARKRGIDLGLDLPEPGEQGSVTVPGLEWLLREALSNLVDNAIRYAPAGGLVTVRVTRQDGKATWAVEDNGPGMSPDDIAHAGVRFRRGAAGKDKPGAGLGLAIVDTITRTHGARLDISNRASGGLHVALVFARGDDPYQ